MEFRLVGEPLGELEDAAFSLYYALEDHKEKSSDSDEIDELRDAMKLADDLSSLIQSINDARKEKE